MKEIKVGNRLIGNGNPIVIQSMTTTKTANIPETVAQIKRLEVAGCEIVRVAVIDEVAANAIAEIKKEISIPIVADIHFDYKLAVLSIKAGANKIRINPGNIGNKKNLAEIVKYSKDAQIPIRVGVNSGSLEKEILEKHGSPNAEALAESALRNAELLEELDFGNIILSMKSSDVKTTIDAYKIASERSIYPLHLGVTEAGTVLTGAIKSSVGIGTLLYMGLGDTIRVSLTGDPVEEIFAAKEILRSLGIRKSGIELISCPTCGRCSVDLEKIALEIGNKTKSLITEKHIKVAIMGCGVNGPGEAKEADIGIAGGVGEYILFVKGEILKKVKEDVAVDILMDEITKIINCK